MCHAISASAPGVSTVWEKRQAAILLQNPAAKASSQAAQAYADAMLAEASRLAAAAAAADAAAQQAVLVAHHMKAAQTAADLAAETLAAPAGRQFTLPSRAPSAPCLRAAKPTVPKSTTAKSRNIRSPPCTTAVLTVPARTAAGQNCQQVKSSSAVCSEQQVLQGSSDPTPSGIQSAAASMTSGASDM